MDQNQLTKSSKISNHQEEIYTKHSQNECKRKKEKCFQNVKQLQNRDRFQNNIEELEQQNISSQPKDQSVILNDYYDLLNNGIIFIDDHYNILKQSRSLLKLLKELSLFGENSYNKKVIQSDEEIINIILNIDLIYHQNYKKKQDDEQEKQEIQPSLKHKQIDKNDYHNLVSTKQNLLDIQNSQEANSHNYEHQKIQNSDLNEELEQINKETEHFGINNQIQTKEDHQIETNFELLKLNNNSFQIQTFSEANESFQIKDLKLNMNQSSQSSYSNLNNNSNSVNINPKIINSEKRNDKEFIFEKMNNFINKQNENDFYQTSQQLFDTHIDDIQQCYIPQNINMIFQSDNSDLKLQKLIDFIIKVKPKIVQTDKERSQFKSEGQICMKNKKEQKKLSQQTKDHEFSSHKYKYYIKNNYLFIQLKRFNNQDQKAQILELKIGCYSIRNTIPNSTKNNPKQFDKYSKSKINQLIINENLSNLSDNKGFCKLSNQIKNFHESRYNNLILNIEKDNVIAETTQRVINKNDQQLVNSDDVILQKKELQQQTNNSRYIFSIEILPINQDIQHLIQSKIDRFTSKLFSSISHELRTPLNCTITMLDMLNIRDDIPDLCKNLFINPALFSSYILLSIINDILDMAEVNRSGEIQLIFQQFSPVSICLECLNFIKLQASSKGLLLEFTQQEEIPSFINSDINKTRQVLLNLLSNALKFTQNGSISINLSSPFEDLIQIDVKDTGCGISNQKINQIFQDFSSLNQDGLKYKSKKRQKNSRLSISSKLSSQTQNNAGLGLSISYMLAACLGNNRKLSVKSELGKGSTFTFFILNQQPFKKCCTLYPKNQNNSNNSLLTKHWIEKDQTEYVSQSQVKNDQTLIELGERRSFAFINSNSACDIKQNYIENKIDKSFPTLKNTEKNQNSDICFKRRYKSYNDIFINVSDDQYLSEKNVCGGQNYLKNVFPQDNISIKKKKKRSQLAACQVNLSKTTLQLIQQTSSIYQFISSQREGDDQIQNTVNRAPSSSIHNFQNKIHLEECQKKSQQKKVNIDEITDYNHQTLYDYDLYTKTQYSQGLFSQNNGYSTNTSKIKQGKIIGQEIRSQEQPIKDTTENFREFEETLFQLQKPSSKIDQQYFLDEVSLCDEANESDDKKQPNYFFSRLLGVKPKNTQDRQNKQQFYEENTAFNYVYNNEEKDQIATINVPLNISMSINYQILEQNGESIKNTDSLDFKKNMQKINNERLCKCTQILVVDDNEFNVYALELRLQQYAFFIDKAYSGIEAIEFVRKKQQSFCCKSYRLIFMDIDMPIKNGYETTKDIIKLCKQLNIKQPIISACSAYVQNQDKVRAFQSGMSYFICKPIYKEEFENVIQQVFYFKDL